MLGVDFGTATSLVAVLDPGGARIVPIGDRTTHLPSVVGIDDGAWVVGEAADDLAVAVRSAKRAITDNLDALPAGESHLPADDVITVLLVEIARRVIRLGLAAPGQPVPGVALGCPAMWTGAQRRRLLGLAARAGLSVSLATLVDEPVAAGIAWLARQPRPVSGRVVVFDMGGGTLDVAVLDVHPDPAHGPAGMEISVLASLGLDHAGDYVDELVAVDLTTDLGGRGVDVARLPSPVRAHNRLVYSAREAKEALSTATEFPIVLPRWLAGEGQELRYRRQQLEETLDFELETARQCVLAALRAALVTERGAGAGALDRSDDGLTAGVVAVVLAGGMTRVPAVARLAREMFPGAVVAPAAARPEEAVALGLAEAGRFGRVNMFRPGFDLVLEWDGGRARRVLYEAYSPLYESWQVTRDGSEPCYRRTGHELHLPQRSDGVLRVVSATGEPVRATMAGRALEGFPVVLDEQRFDLAIYCDGSLALTDGSGSYAGEVGWTEIHRP